MGHLARDAGGVTVPGPAAGLVLAGGGARGAYEAGVLAELLPWLEHRGERPRVLVGTSVGALNAAHLAATAHLPADEAAGRLVDLWAAVTQDAVIHPIVTRTAPLTALRYLGELTGTATLHALLDPTPLRATLDDWLDWDDVRRNVADGTVDALAVVATSTATERATVFVEGRRQDELASGALVDALALELTTDHLLASAAIPVIFPAVELPAPAAGWWYDGGTRLNTPIKPAIDLGCARVAVVATHAPFRPHGTAAAPGPRPDFAEGALELLQATLVDPLIEDLRTLGKINQLVGDDEGRAGYRQVPFLFAGPPEMARLGEVVQAARRDLGSLDVAVLSRLLGGASRSHDELLSYLLFEPAFIGRAIAAGREDAAAHLAAAGDGAWRLSPPVPPAER